jgi:hypothetical protein
MFDTCVESALNLHPNPQKSMPCARDSRFMVRTCGDVVSVELFLHSLYLFGRPITKNTHHLGWLSKPDQIRYR